MNSDAKRGASNVGAVPTGKKPTPGPLSRKIGRLVRQMIEEDGHSQASVAQQIGMSQSQLSKCLRGERILDVEQLDALAHLFDTTAVQILREAARLGD